MQSFLDGNQAPHAIKELLRKADTIRIAVAYWGKGAIKRLGLSELTARNITIVCNLQSGACNPKEIKKLQELFGESNVLSNNRLHGKVWYTEKGAIVGSSNASANGLGFEGPETSGLIEANIFTDEPATLTRIRRWLEAVGESAHEIGKEDFAEARKRWSELRRRRSILRPSGSSLLKAIQASPATFDDRNIYVWVCEWEKHSKEAERVFEDEKKLRRSTEIDFWEEVDEDDPANRPGSIVIEFGLEENRVEYVGTYQVLSDEPYIKQEKMLLCKTASDVLGYKIGKGKEKSIWEKAAQLAWDEKKNDWSGSLTDFIEYLRKSRLALGPKKLAKRRSK